jgi:hypothetical protein
MRIAALATVLLFGAVITGCPPNTCFFEVCNNGQCSCPISSCVDGAEFDTKKRTCVCNPDRLGVAGQCMTQADANAYCGRGFNFQNGGCQKIVCANGTSLDEASGQCVANTQVAGNLGVQVGQGETLQCSAGTVLVIEGGSGACVPQEQTCAPDEQWNGNACTKQVQCPTGASWDAARNACVAFAKTGDDAAQVDVVTWAQSNYGVNGGKGTSSFCNRFAHKPWRFGVSQGQTATLQIGIQLSFAGGDVKGGSVATKASFAGNPLQVPPSGVEAVQTGAADVLSSLTKGGGNASTPGVSTMVHCTVQNAAAPIVVPATGGV